MRILNKKIINVGILFLVLITVLSTQTYAKPFTDSFRGGLIQINDFFEKEQYKPYSNAIDFFFFALLFISIYLMGVRYAFKEVKRPEQVIAILLGLMTAFLLVLGGFSATILLPYISWIFYILLFILYWWLLKGIKSRFWRFILALLLTLLTIGLAQGVFGALTTPDTEGFFKSFSKSLGTIQFPEITGPLGVPPDLTGLFGAAPTTTGPSTLPTTPTPTVPIERVPPTPEAGGLSWWAWILIVFALALAGFGAKKGYDAWRRIRPAPAPTPTLLAEERTIAEIIAKINEIITNKGNSRQRVIRVVLRDKSSLIVQGDAKTGFIAKLGEIAEGDVANLFLDESRTLEELEEGNVKEIIKKQREFFQELKKLSETENSLYQMVKLDPATGQSKWETIILQSIADDKKISAKSMLYILKVLMDQNIQQRAEDTQKGILWLIAYCYNLEGKQNILLKELANLFEETHIKDLIKGQFKTAIRDTQTLDAYNQREKRIIGLLSRRLLKQIDYLKELQRLIEATSPKPTAPTTSSLTVKINTPAPNSRHIISYPIRNIEAEAEGPQSELINSGTVPNIRFVWHIEQKSEVPESYPMQTIHIGRTGISKPISSDIFVPEKEAELTVFIFEGDRELANTRIPIRLIKPPQFGINRMGAVKRERALLKRISNSFKRIKEKLPRRDRIEIEESAQIAENADGQLLLFEGMYEEHERKGLTANILPTLKQKSQEINRFVRKIIQVLEKRKFIEPAKQLELFEEERARALEIQERTQGIRINLAKGIAKRKTAARTAIPNRQPTPKIKINLLPKEKPITTSHRPIAHTRVTPLQYLYLKPLDATPEKPILIISEYHKDPNHEFLIGIEKDSEIVLKDSDVKDANQAVIGFDEDEGVFMIGASPNSRIAINGIEQGIAAKLYDGLKLDINNYAFAVYIEQKEKAGPLQRAEYEQQFPVILNKRMIAPTPAPEIQILSPTNNKEFNLGDTITLKAEINLDIPPQGFEYRWFAVNIKNEIDELTRGIASTNIVSDTIQFASTYIEVGKYEIGIVLINAFPERTGRDRNLISEPRTVYIIE